jgi:hypothetical protein
MLASKYVFVTGSISKNLYQNKLLGTGGEAVVKVFGYRRTAGWEVLAGG